MAAPREISVSLALIGEQSTTGKATLIDRPIVSRVGRGAIVLLGLWFVAGLCIFIPLAHFVLVPSFAIAGIAMFVVRVLDDTSLVQAEGVCPRCHVQRTFEGAGRYRPGRTVHCAGCGSQIAVT